MTRLWSFWTWTTVALLHSRGHAELHGLPEFGSWTSAHQALCQGEATSAEMPLKTDMLGTLLLLGIAWFCLVLQANARSEVGHLMCHHICFSKVFGKLLRKCGPHLSFRKWPSSQLVGG